MTPITDWLSVTTSSADFPSIRGDLDQLASDAGFSALDVGLWRPPGGGQFRVRVTHGVGQVMASGRALATLRAMRCFLELLSICGSVPHRVTRLDAAYDVPEFAGEVVRGLYSRALDGGVALTRKAIRPGQVRAMLSQDDHGRETGTVYLGDRRTTDVSARVYDKRWQLLQQEGLVVDDLTRYEITARAGVGASLHDAADPTSLFWHFASPGLLSAPVGVPPWSPHGEGFHMDRPPALSPYDRLRRHALDGDAAGELVRLALACGPAGLDHLDALLRRRAAQVLKGSPTVGAAGRTTSGATTADPASPLDAAAAVGGGGAPSR
jgi:hypothetical protein